VSVASLVAKESGLNRIKQDCIETLRITAPPMVTLVKILEDGTLTSDLFQINLPK
jgi:hypothetical protein